MKPKTRMSQMYVFFHDCKLQGLLEYWVHFSLYVPRFSLQWDALRLMRRAQVYSLIGRHCFRTRQKRRTFADTAHTLHFQRVLRTSFDDGLYSVYGRNKYTLVIIMYAGNTRRTNHRKRLKTILKEKQKTFGSKWYVTLQYVTRDGIIRYVLRPRKLTTKIIRYPGRPAHTVLFWAHICRVRIACTRTPHMFLINIITSRACALILLFSTCSVASHDDPLGGGNDKLSLSRRRVQNFPDLSSSSVHE